MVVDDLDIPGFVVAPCKTDAPLVVDTNAMLSLSIALQRLQAIAGRYTQIIEPRCRVDGQDLRPSPLLDLHRQAANGIAGKDGRGSLVGEALDHGKTYHKTVRNVNRYVPFHGTYEYALSL